MTDYLVIVQRSCAIPNDDKAIQAPLGYPVTFEVHAVYLNGARQKVAAHDIVPGDEQRGYLPAVSYLTDDGEFLIFVARRPIDGEQLTEWPTQSTPPLDDGAPF